MLNVRVVLHRVADDVVHVVRALPPPGRDPPCKVAESDTDHIVVPLVLCDAVVAQIVSNKGQLLPVTPQ